MATSDEELAMMIARGENTGATVRIEARKMKALEAISELLKQLIEMMAPPVIGSSEDPVEIGPALQHARRRRGNVGEP